MMSSSAKSGGSGDAAVVAADERVGNKQTDGDDAGDTNDDVVGEAARFPPQKHGSGARGHLVAIEGITIEDAHGVFR